ncbi:hypothetical protein V8F20_000303 [Naviculisporaceae sp. PSN 640]
MPAAAARALLSAKGSCQHHVPRVAAAARATVVVAQKAQRHRHGGGGGVSGARGFRTSSAAALASSSSPAAESSSSSSNPNPAATEEKTTPPPPSTENKAAAATNANTDKTDSSPAASEAEHKNLSENATTKESESSTTPETAPGAASEATTAKDVLKTSNSRRIRAARLARTEMLENPPLEVPTWFMDEYVSLYESRPIGRHVLQPLDEDDREALLALEESRFDAAALTDEDVDFWKKAFSISLQEPSRYEDTTAVLKGRLEDIHRAVFLQLLSLVHREGGETGRVVDHVKKMRAHFLERGGGMTRFPWWKTKLPTGDTISGEVQRWMANLRLDAEIDLLMEEEAGMIHASPLAERPHSEYSVCMELLAAVRAELWADIPKGRRNIERPVTVLSVLNRKGRGVASSVMEDIATDLKADVVHLDAASIASLVGNYLGQNTYSRRGSIATLGYSAAEMNGRLAQRGDGESEQEVGMVTFTLPSRLRSILSSKDSSSSSGLDARWEDVKVVNALESLIKAAAAKRVAQGLATRRRDLIIHVHDYVEINSLQSGIISKLRAVVDTMWQKGVRIVLVGSTASELQRTTQLREQLTELGQDGHHHIIPFQAADTAVEHIEKRDNFLENINNIKNMLQARLHNKAVIDFNADSIEWFNDSFTTERWNPKLVEKLSRHVYDAQWVHRLTSIMCGGPVPRSNEFRLDSLEYALYFIASRNKFWRDVYPGVKSPYYSPLSVPKNSSSSSSPSMPSFMSSSSGGSEDSAWRSNLPKSAQSKEFDQHEKKLLSGLINADDIHTTFNEIIVPQETKESLIGLTSLSLVRPDAFSYGVLKSERIPGCLLYGPPGTGKTLLAKAVAKESGANMLEVSAASINEMWMGQSEKNVRALFSLARKLAPMVIFLDEADALLGARHHAPGRSGHRETITQFLREWDGLSDMRAFIMVATNRPFDLDEAVLRRLPRKILVDLPLAKERESILRVMLREEQLAPEVDLAQLARETELYSGSDLKNLCVSAAMEAVRDECRAQEAHKAAEAKKPEGEERVPYEFPAKRVLTRRHFDKGLREISASISEDMDSLKAIRKFDEQYGDAGGKKKRRRGMMGFEVVKERGGTEEARVRRVALAESETGGEAGGTGPGKKTVEPVPS